MSYEEQTFIDEAELGDVGLEPSERFARLLKRVGERTGVGALGLDAIRTSVLRSVHGE